MQISDQTKRYLLVYGIFIAILYIIYDATSNKFTCDKWANDFRDNNGFNLVLTKKTNNNSRNAYLDGVDLTNKETTEFHDGSGWIAHNFDKFNIGDTLTKKIGKYTIVIKRKGKTILIPFECDKIYRDR
ncbi:MAG: hypothetical protein ACXVJD_05110 [Mucilaginibacter sp.]